MFSKKALAGASATNAFNLIFNNRSPIIIPSLINSILSFTKSDKYSLDILGFDFQ